MSGRRIRFWRDLSIQNKVLVIILPLIIVPMLILAAVGFVTSSREAATLATRYLSQRETDLRTIAENPAIPSYFNNKAYGLTEEAEVSRRGGAGFRLSDQGIPAHHRRHRRHVPRHHGAQPEHRRLYHDQPGPTTHQPDPPAGRGGQPHRSRPAVGERRDRLQGRGRSSRDLLQRDGGESRAKRARARAQGHRDPDTLRDRPGDRRADRARPDAAAHRRS